MLAYQLFALTPPLPSSRAAAMPIFGSNIAGVALTARRLIRQPKSFPFTQLQLGKGE